MSKGYIFCDAGEESPGTDDLPKAATALASRVKPTAQLAAQLLLSPNEALRTAVATELKAQLPYPSEIKAPATTDREALQGHVARAALSMAIADEVLRKAPSASNP
jgi:hypothetical protein